MYKQLLIPYDIIDNIIKYLDVESSRKFLLCNSNIYYTYRHSKYFNSIFIKKICNHFSSLSKINLNLNDKLSDKLNAKTNIYNILNDIFNYYKYHRDVSLSDLLVYLSEYNTTWHNYLFKIIISRCYYSKKHNQKYTYNYAYNLIKNDDLIYILLFKKNITLITKYISIDVVILSQVIKSKLNLNDVTNVVFLINYLLHKHFFKYPRYIEEILSDIICNIIRLSNFTHYYNILIKIYQKQPKYKFILNYQKIVNACMQQTRVEYLSLIHAKIIEQKKILKLQDMDIYPIIISKDYFRNLIKNRNYAMLDKIIELFLGDKINMSIYFNEIYDNFDTSTRECDNLFNHLTNINRLKLLER